MRELKRGLLVLYPAVGVMVLAGAVLAGCGKASNPPEDKTVAEEVIDEDKNISENNTSDNKESEINEKVSEAKEGAGTELYDAFMNNEAEIVFHTLGHDGAYYEFNKALTDGESYTLEELTQKLSDYMEVEGWGEKPTIGNAEKTMIDCALDGKEEMLLEIEMPVEGVEEFIVSMIVKDMGGELKLCYVCDSWSRSYTSISGSGYIVNDGSNGAASHISDYSFVDAEGNWKVYYSCSTDMGFATEEYYAPVTGWDDYNIISFSGLDVEHFAIERYCYDLDANGSDYFYTYYFTDENYEKLPIDPAIYDDSNEYKKKFTEYGLKVYSMDEINKLLEDRKTEIGLTDEVINY